MPSLRKLAVPVLEALDVESDSLSTAIDPPFNPEDRTLPLEGKQPGPQSGRSTPGVGRSFLAWQIWVPAALLALLTLGALRHFDVVVVLVPGVFVAVMLVGAMRLFPPPGAPVRRLLPWLALYTLPWIVSIACGPLGFVEVSWHQSEREKMIQFQGWLMAAGGILPFLLWPVMRGGRGFTAVMGILNFVVTFLATSVAIITNTPGA